MSTSSEKALWTGHPSHLIGLRFYTISVLIGAAIITGALYIPVDGIWMYALIGLGLVVLAILYKMWDIRSTEYELTTDRLRIESGLLSKKTEELELYRVRDWSVYQPFYLRPVGYGDVILETSDATAGKITLEAVKKPKEVRELIRTHVEAARDKKHVRHLDVDGGGGDAAGM